MCVCQTTFELLPNHVIIGKLWCHLEPDQKKGEKGAKMENNHKKGGGKCTKETSIYLHTQTFGN